MLIVDYYSRYYEYEVMTSTTSEKETMDLNSAKMNSRNTANRMELCTSKTKANGEVEGQNVSLCAPSGKEIVLVMIHMQRHLRVVFSYHFIMLVCKMRRRNPRDKLSTSR